MMYNELLIDCFFNPLHVGELDLHDSIEVQAKNMRLYLYLDGNKIGKMRFKARAANPYKIAGLEWLCRVLEGDLLSNHPKIDYKQIVKALDIPPLKYAEAIALEGIYKMLITTAKNER